MLDPPYARLLDQLIELMPVGARADYSISLVVILATKKNATPRIATITPAMIFSAEPCAAATMTYETPAITNSDGRT